MDSSGLTLSCPVARVDYKSCLPSGCTASSPFLIATSHCCFSLSTRLALSFAWFHGRFERGAAAVKVMWSVSQPTRLVRIVCPKGIEGAFDYSLYSQSSNAKGSFIRL
jgi:hypothetical protein